MSELAEATFLGLTITLLAMLAFDGLGRLLAWLEERNQAPWGW